MKLCNTSFADLQEREACNFVAAKFTVAAELLSVFAVVKVELSLRPELHVFSCKDKVVTET